MTSASPDMRRDFASRDDLIAYLKDKFPTATAIDAHVSPTRGGRTAALTALEAVDPPGYAATRNKLRGKVTRLSPYIRYGVVGLAEAKRAALAKARNRDEAGKLVNELGWRDYFQRVYAKLGDGVWQDQEGYKTGCAPGQYAQAMPTDVLDGTTGLACMDAFSDDLRRTGYLHNHARMWLAAYIVHWRRVRWQAGARWFLTHLLDGDPASNNLSWQWVASTFSSKPYLFNRETLERFTDGAYCKRCPLAGRCAFEGSYEDLEARLFPNKPADVSDAPRRPGGRR